MSEPVDLWLDDERAAPEGWTAATSREAAIEVVLQGPVRRMSLDHDLGPSGVYTGMDFVEWLAKTRRWPAVKPWVHSANPGGSANMRALIDRAWAPVEAAALARLKGYVHTTAAHHSCADAACCTCACYYCLTEWQNWGRPTEHDCPIHGRRP